MPEDRELLGTVFASSWDGVASPAEEALSREFLNGGAGKVPRSLVRRVNESLPTSAPRSRNWWAWLMRPMVLGPGAAALAGVLIVTSLNLPDRGEGLSVGMDTVERSQSLELLAPKGELANSPEVLRWKVLPAAILYRVKMMEVDRNVIWETQANGTSVLVPGAIRSKALKGKRLLWQVEAFDDKGQSIGVGKQDFRRALVQ